MSSSSSSSSSSAATTTATTASSSLYTHQMPSTLTTTINIINTNTHAAAASQLKLQQLKSTQYGNYLTLNQQQHHNQSHINNNFSLNRTFQSNENGNSVTNALVKHESLTIVKNEPNETKSINENNNNTNTSSNNNFSLDVYVNNVVCSYSTKCHLNLRKIATEGMHVEYKRENGVRSLS